MTKMNSPAQKRAESSAATRKPNIVSSNLFPSQGGLILKCETDTQSTVSPYRSILSYGVSEAAVLTRLGTMLFGGLINNTAQTQDSPRQIALVALLVDFQNLLKRQINPDRKTAIVSQQH